MFCAIWLVIYFALVHIYYRYVRKRITKLTVLLAEKIFRAYYVLTFFTRPYDKFLI